MSRSTRQTMHADDPSTWDLDAMDEVRKPLRAKRLSDVVPYRVARLNAEMVKVLTRFCEAHGLTFHQWRVLSLIGDFGFVVAADVCKWTTNDKAVVSRVIRQLLDRGLIRRRRDLKDGRKMVIALEPAGEELYATVGKLMDGHEERILTGLGERKIQELVATLRLLEQRTREVLDEMERARLTRRADARDSRPIG